jgi:hypothetical protein
MAMPAVYNFVWGETAFERVCELADADHWCWKLGCTTCGAMFLRYGLRELTLGRDPGVTGWVTRRRLRGDVLEKRVGPMAGLQPWGLAEQQRLIDVAAKARVDQIVRQCAWPNGLGYLGFVLDVCSSAEWMDRTLTRQWGAALASLLPARNSLGREFSERAAGEGRVLAPSDMERLETEMLAQRRSLLSALTDDDLFSGARAQ